MRTALRAAVGPLKEELNRKRVLSSCPARKLHLWATDGWGECEIKERPAGLHGKSRCDTTSGKWMNLKKNKLKKKDSKNTSYLRFPFEEKCFVWFQCVVELELEGEKHLDVCVWKHISRHKALQEFASLPDCEACIHGNQDLRAHCSERRQSEGKKRASGM